MSLYLVVFDDYSLSCHHFVELAGFARLLDIKYVFEKTWLELMGQ